MIDINRAVIMAHYHRDGILSGHVLALIECLAKASRRFILVSTSLLDSERDRLPSTVEVIIRKNIGYDFYSYKIGVELLSDLWIYDELILVNDSFFTIKPELLVSTMREMEGVSTDMWGITASSQIEWHLQSYFVAFRKSAFVTAAFQEFWNGVELLANKWEIILSYEIGMTLFFLKRGFCILPAYKPTLFDRLVSAWRIRKNSRLPSLLGFASFVLLPRRARQVNPVHFLWDRLITRVGIVKNEVLRDNPNMLDLSKLPQLVGPTAAARLRDQFPQVFTEIFQPLKIQVEESASPLPRSERANALTVEQTGRDVAVVVHLFHYDLLQTIRNYLDKIVIPHDVFVSVRSVEDAHNVQRALNRPGRGVFSYVEPNVGRDIGPFFSLLNTGKLDRYLCVCKIHSKKSAYSDQGSEWRDQLYEGVLGTSLTVLRIVDMFRSDKSCGLIGADRAFVSNARFWGANKQRMEELARRIGMPEADVSLGFFAGTMFWFRPAALDGLKRLQISEKDFETEAGQRDGTLAHALERFIPLAVKHAGYHVATDKFPFCQVDVKEYENNQVLVL
jgi:rhamnosyltransferase